MDVKACPKCGSRDIRMAGMRNGIIFGLTSYNLVCKKCNYKGMPIIFDSEKEYEKFFRELKNR
jgi:C4-type Zn-finger protein